MQFRDALRLAREAAGMTKRALGRASGAHRTWISRIEHGRAKPRLDTIWRLASGLGVEFRCSERGWSTGPAGEADGLREGLREVLAGHRRAFGDRASSCDECGFGVLIDEDGCCTTCGRDATPEPASFIVLRPEQMDQLRKLVGRDG